jgi:peptidoglycan DL-endopeptidase CwlO
MAARLRLLLLVLTLTHSLVFGAAGALGSGSHKHRAHARQARRAAPALPALGERAVAYARRLIGIPYRWGGTSPGSGFDCSGFVRYVYGRLGITLPHSSYADFALGRRVGRGSLRPGDLVFFDGVGHVGLYVGAGKFIHAPHSGTRVQISSLVGYAGYDGARRIVAGPRLLLRG